MINMVTTTSRRQGRRREAGSGGSPRQSCDLTDRKVLRGRVPGASQHQMAKPSGSEDTVKDPGVQRPFTLGDGTSPTIRGDLPHMRAARYGSRTEAHPERDGSATFALQRRPRALGKSD